jgi:eukaryotic-like serine/threonine-protein kinase
LLRGPEGIEVGELGPDSQLRVRDLDGKIVRTVPFTTTGELAGQALRTSGDLRVLGQDKHALLALRDASGDLHYSRLSPDGSCLAQATPGPPGRMNLVLYKMATGERTGPCVARSALIWDLSFSPDSTRVASADDAGVVSIWNTRTGENVAACVGHSSKALSAAFRPDGKRLVTASADGTVRQWEWDANGAREVEPPYERHSGEVLAAVYSPDGEWIASAGTDRTIRVWRASGRQEAAVLHGHTGAVVELAFTPDGKRLVSRSENRSGAWLGDNTAGIWDVDFGGGLPVLLGHTWYVYPAMFSPDGRWIASGSWDRTLRIWDAKTGDPCAEFPNGDYTRTLTFSPDSTRIVSVQRRQPQIWDIVTRRHWKDFPQLDSLGHAAAFHPDGTTLAVLGGSGQVLVFDLATRTVVKTLSLGAAHDTKALAYSPDGRWLAGTDKDLKTVCVFDARTYEQKAQFTGHEGIVRTLAFSADGGSSPRPERTASSASGRSLAARVGCWKGTPTRCSRWRFTRTARGWRRAAATGRSGSGIWRLRKNWSGCRVTPATSGRWTSAPTAKRWCPAPVTRRCACGTPRRWRIATRRAGKSRRSNRRRSNS